MSYPTRATGRSRPLVRHTYDWATVSPHALLDTVKFPLVTEAQLEDTLVTLDEAAGGS